MIELTTPLFEAVELADGLLITSGAGMGVDSGLPDFRGENGFWRAYPALKESGIDFYDIANPDSFHSDPKQAWGFYGHRLNLYRQTIPNAGFTILSKLAKRMPNGSFIYTSNVDGQFQKAGFSEMQIIECHGSIHHLQCLDSCMDNVWSADDFHPETDDVACQLISSLPLCPHCGKVSRPNIYMFNDMDWINSRKITQRTNLDQWLNKVERLLVIEIGAGTRISTARDFSESQGGFLIRINPDESKIPSYVNGISLPMGGLAGLQLLADILKL